MADLTVVQAVDDFMASANQAAMRTNLGLGSLAVLSAAPAGTLTGTTLASGVTSAALTTLSALTSNGFVKTSGGTGALSIDTATYLTTAVTSLTGTAGQITASASTGAVTLSLPSALTGINSVTSATGQALTLATLDSNANVVLTPNGSGKVVTANRVSIGALDDATVNLDVNKTLTGATDKYGIASRGIAQSDVTATATGFYGAVGTAAASFALGAIETFAAFNGVKGAGSSITTLIGFSARDLTNGTNNFGFRGQVSSGTNKYNLYMDGTAANYLAGALTVGGAVTLSALTSNGLVTTSGGTGAISITVPGTGVLTALAVNVGTDGAFVVKGGALGTPSSGTLTNCTFPTLNQNTTGSAASLSISGQTGLLTFTGLTSTNRIKTVRDAADTILELGGSYTPTGTWTSLTMVTPVLGTPTSGALTNCTADGTNSVGFRGVPQNSQSAAYTTVLADAGKCLFHPASDANARTFTIDSNANVAYAVGTVIEFINMSANNVTIAITSDTLTLLPAGTTGSRTLAQYGRASAEKISSTAWVISGNSALT